MPLVLIFIILGFIAYKIYIYIKERMFNAAYELSLWQVYLEAKKINDSSLFNTSNFISKFVEISGKRFIKSNVDREAIKMAFEKTYNRLKETKGIYSSFMRRGKEIDFSLMFKNEISENRSE